MNFVETPVKDLYIIEPKVHADERGYFFESFRDDKLNEFLKSLQKEKIHFIQDNESKSTKGVLRGLHYQLPPMAQTKLVRVVQGSIFDVAVDIRKSSSSFGKWFGMELSAENKKQLLIPAGFAHGFLTLSDTAIVQYKVDNYYSKEHDRGILYNDAAIGIEWPFAGLTLSLSGKDQVQPKLQEIG